MCEYLIEEGYYVGIRTEDFYSQFLLDGAAENGRAEINEQTKYGNLRL